MIVAGRLSVAVQATSGPGREWSGIRGCDLGWWWRPSSSPCWSLWRSERAVVDGRKEGQVRLETRGQMASRTRCVPYAPLRASRVLRDSRAVLVDVLCRAKGCCRAIEGLDVVVRARDDVRGTKKCRKRAPPLTSQRRRHVARPDQGR